MVALHRGHIEKVMQKQESFNFISWWKFDITVGRAMKFNYAMKELN